MDNGILFTGSPDEIVKACPREFFNKTDTWHALAQSIMTNDVSCSNWKFVDSDRITEQCMYLDTLCSNTTIEAKDKIAIVSWMLSSMLTEVPIYTPPREKGKLRKPPRGITEKLARKKTA